MNSNKLILFLVLSGCIVFTTCKKVEKVMSVTTGIVTNLTTLSATLSGKIIDLGNGVTQHGHCYSKTQNSTIDSSKTQLGIQNDVVEFTSNLTDLEPGTKYYFKAYLSDGTKTVYGEERSFTTLAAYLPTISTVAITSITSSSAICSGNITYDGGAPVTKRGVCWNNSGSGSPTTSDNITSDGTGTGEYESNLTSLAPGREFSARAYATNFAGTAYGNELIFRTNSDFPTVKTFHVISITTTSAICGGEILNDNGSSITDRGVCWSTGSNPTVNDNKISDGYLAEIQLNGLTSNTIYHVRAFATNNIGTGYGAEVVFKTFTGLVNDYDGNSYYSITIGTQVWLVKNLSTTHYRNGDLITNITGGIDWIAAVSGAYCWYENNISNKDIFGAMYNHYAVEDARGLCPSGWHVSNEEEWNVLVNYGGGLSVAGGKLKDSLLWNSPNLGGSNSSGFTALPGGSRGWDDGHFYGKGIYGHWWTSTYNPPVDPPIALLRYNYEGITFYSNIRRDGFSVRCIKDN
jgi:uncharacterized protein (TIGR02145 family)